MPPTASRSSRPSRPPRRSHPRTGDGVRSAPRSGPRPPFESASSPNAESMDQPSDEIQVVPEVATFGELGVAPVLVDALAGLGITRPFPIQAASLPSALAGRDLLARGRTGSGKTAAFAVPVVARLAAAAAPPAVGRRNRRPRALVLVPTRELATQVAATFEPLARAVGLRVTTIFGGVPQGRQERALAEGVDIIIACPGRLDDLVNQGRCPLDAIEITVLDEADHLADLGFLPTVRRLLDRTPTNGQRLLFSATLDAQVDAVVQRYLHDPIRCSVDPVAVAPVHIEHHVLTVATEDKNAVVATLAGGLGPVLLFTRTKHNARKLAKRLAGQGIAAVDLHGDLAQTARERNLAAFRDGRARVLVATDIAARGIHVDGISLVVHVDPPAEAKAFVHRSGRTARAGSDGVVVTLATPDQRSDVDKLTRVARIKPTMTSVTPDHPLLERLRGEEAELLAIPLVLASANAAPSNGRGPGGGTGVPANNRGWPRTAGPARRRRNPR